MKNTISKKPKFHETQKFAIIIPILFLICGVIKMYVQRFRISIDFHWIFVFGNLGTLLIALVCIVFSFINSFLIIRELKLPLLQKTLWLLLSSSVLLYFTIMMTIAILIN